MVKVTNYSDICRHKLTFVDFTVIDVHSDQFDKLTQHCQRHAFASLLCKLLSLNSRTIKPQANIPNI